MTLNDLIEATRTLPGDAPLVFSTADGPIGEGYHVTELKLAHIDSIDCGAQTSSWTEATLQLLDGQGEAHMPVGKFTTILDQSVRRVGGLGQSPLRVEFAHKNTDLRIFEPAAPEFVDGMVSLELRPAHAQCKPAMKVESGTERSETKEAGCCGGPAASGVDACCVRDAEAKAAGEAGCGCGDAGSSSSAKTSGSSASGCCS